MIDDDLDAPEDFDNENGKGPEGHSEKLSLKEIWENNPALKIVALVVVLVLGLGIYVLFSGEEAAPTKFHVNPNATQIPGQKDVDPEYRQQLEEANRKHAEEMANAGQSHIGIPIAVSSGTGLKVPTAPEQPKSDVLEEWKKVAENSRMKAAKDAVDEENQAPAPEVVPMVQPIRPQEVKQDPNLSRHLIEQMREIIGKQGAGKASILTVTKEDSLYTAMKKKEDALASATNAARNAGGNTAGSGATGRSSSNKVIIPAGTINYAQLLTQLNSDLPGPVLAQVLSGPFTGGRLIGSLKANDECECMAIEFKEVVKDTVTYKIDAYGVDQNTSLTGIDASSVDHHYFVRYVLPAAASILTGNRDAHCEHKTKYFRRSDDGFPGHR
jgi:intracellular multiplication protein IcmE